MERVAVVAHRGKTLGGGLTDLRAQLRRAGIEDLLWYEVPKSRKAPACVHEALEEGAELVLVWGGDGMVQRSVDVLAGREAAVGILPAGTANVLATNLGIPRDLTTALEIALNGRDRRIDVGTVNGEHFAVMSGVGFDARMIASTDASKKAKLGRLAYVTAGARATRVAPDDVRIDVDGTRWFEGPASCVLVGNVGTSTGGLVVFEQAELDDGILDIGVVTADGTIQWLRVLARAASGQAARSPFVQVTRAREIDIHLDRKTPYELDGGARKPVKRLRYGIEPGAVSVRVPR
jgi:YegS/Rv2252/BmrU family lipid kinase